MTVFDEQSFEERYRATDALWSGRPNTQLVREAADAVTDSVLDEGVATELTRWFPDGTGPATGTSR